MAGLFFDSGIDKGFEEDLKRMNKQMRSLGSTVQKEGTLIDKTFKNIGANIAGFVSVSAIGAAGKELIDFTTNLESSLTEVATISSTITNDFQGYKNAVLELSTDEERGAEGAIALTEALYDVVSAGFDGEEALQLLAESGLAATAGFVETSVAADGLTTVLNAWGKSADEAGAVSDIFFKTVERGKTTFDELGKNIAKVAPLASSMGISFEEVGGAIATVTKQGTKTPEALTQLRAAMISMNKVLGDGWAEAMSFQEALQVVADKAGGSQNALKELLGTDEAVLAVLALTGENARGAAADLDAMSDSLGATAAAAAKVTDTTANQISILKNNILAALEPLGTEASGVIADLAKSLNAAFQSGDIQRYAKVLLTLGKAFIAYKVTILALNKAAKLRKFLLLANIEATQISIVTGKKMTAQNLLMAKSFNKLKGAFLANPIGILVGALTLAIPLIHEFVTAQDKVVRLQKELDTVRLKAEQSEARSIVRLKQLLVTARDETKSLEARKGAIKALNAISPEYLGGLELATINAEEAKAAIDRYTKALLHNARIQAASEQLIEIQKELNNLRLKGAGAEVKFHQKLINAIIRGAGVSTEATSNKLTEADNLIEKEKELLEIEEALLKISTEEEKLIKDDASDPDKDPDKDPEKSLKALKLLLSSQRKAYEQYNVDIKGLTDERLVAVENEYSALTDQGKTYLKFLEKLLAEEKNVKKQAIIKEEIVKVTFEQEVNEQKTAQETFDKQEKELTKLLEQYSTYQTKREKIFTEFDAKITQLRKEGYEEQAEQAEKALQEELNRLDESIVSGNAKFKEWLTASLPKLAAAGIEALQKELENLELALETGGLDPEQVVIYQAKIKELNKQLGKKGRLETSSENTWKDTLEILNGVNALANDLVNNFESFDTVTAGILTGITKVGSGIVQMIHGIKAFGAGLKAVEKASVVLSIIGTALQVINAVTEVFRSRAEKAAAAAEARQKALVKELTQIQAINIALIQQNALYKEGNDIFTDDRWGTALAGLEAYNLALMFQEELLKTINTVQIGGNPLGLSAMQLLKLGKVTADLLDVFPEFVDANGKINESLLDTILLTEDLTDADRKRLENLRDILDQAEQAYSQFGDFISSIFGGIGDDITQAFQTMFETGDDAMTALEGSFSDMIENFTRQAIEFAFLQPYLDALNEKTKALGEQFARGDITAEELQQSIILTLGNFYNQISALQPSILQAFEDADRLAALAGFEAAFNTMIDELDEDDDRFPILPADDDDEEPEKEPVSQAGLISQAITEETGSLLVGRLGALMMSNERIAQNSSDGLELGVQNLIYLKQIKSNTDFLPVIAENTRKTYEKLETI